MFCAEYIRALIAQTQIEIKTAALAGDLDLAQTLISRKFGLRLVLSGMEAA